MVRHVRQKSLVSGHVSWDLLHLSCFFSTLYARPLTGQQSNIQFAHGAHSGDLSLPQTPRGVYKWGRYLPLRLLTSDSPGVCLR